MSGFKEKRWSILVILGLIFLIAIIVFFWRSRHPHSVWQPATHSFSIENCTRGKCKEFLRLPPLGDMKVSFLVDPEVDDEIAQWSDCLASVAKCMDKGADYSGKALIACVKQSACPQACKESFSHKASSLSDDDKVWALYNSQFVDEGGECLP